jgi:CCR4-NOT transcription complex subunit 3
METFKACEKESKTKAYSREGLEASKQLDPLEEERQQMREWVQDTQQTLTDQMNILDAELEALGGKKNRDLEAMNHTQGSLDKLKYHYDKLDLLLRKSENDGCVNPEKFQELQEVFECFISADFNYECEDSFTQVYGDLDVLKSASGLGSIGSQEDDSGSVHSDSTAATKKPVAVKKPLEQKPPGKLEVKEERRAPASVWDAPPLSRCSSAPVSDKAPPVIDRPAEPLPPAEKPPEKPAEPCEKPALLTLLGKLTCEAELQAEELDIEAAQELIDTSFFYAVRANDRARPSLIVLNTPFPCHPSFPKRPLFSEAARIKQMELDTLFFIFYHQPGTYQQYLAAKCLHSKNWQYHKKEQTWFQREDTARGKSGKGTYFYFDYTASWSQRIRQDFLFETQSLEAVSSD